jgi:hypothetical protein
LPALNLGALSGEGAGAGEGELRRLILETEGFQGRRNKPGREVRVLCSFLSLMRLSSGSER